MTRTPLPCPQTLGGEVRNLYRQHSRTTTVQFRPTSLAELVDAVIRSGSWESGVRAAGSYYSLSATAMPDTVAIRTRGLLNRQLSHPITSTVRRFADERYRSTQHRSSILDRIVSVEWRGRNPRRRLVHVEAGVQLRELIADLQRVGLAVPTMGSGSNQTLAGAVATGTHGSDWDVPPLGDFIRAVHLVSQGGQEWWIEGSDGLTTNETITRMPLWDESIRCIRNDDALAAVQVACGRFGVWYSVVLEAVPQYGLSRETFEISWEAFEAQLRTTVSNGWDDPGSLTDGGSIRALEAIYEPNNGVVRVTKRALDLSVTEPSGVRLNDGGDFFLETICTPVHRVAAFVLALNTVAGIMDGLAGKWSLVPLYGWYKAGAYQWAAWQMRALAIEVSSGHLNAGETITRLIAIFREDGLSELRGHVAEMIGSAVLDGQRPLGSWTGLSYEMMDTSVPSDDAGCPNVDSVEVFFDWIDDSVITYLRTLARRFRARRPTELFYSLRLSGPSRALLGQERGSPTIAVEVAAIRPGQTEEVLRAAREATEIGAILHWGQMRHESRRVRRGRRTGYGGDDIERLFGERLRRWRSVLAYVEQFDNRGVFSTSHSRSLGLEWDGLIDSATVPDYEDRRVGSLWEPAFSHPHY